MLDFSSLYDYLFCDQKMWLSSRMLFKCSSINWQENQGESFEELQELFEEMFQSDIETFSSSSRTATPSTCSSSSSASCSESYFNISTKRSSDEMSNPSRFKSECSEFDRFCMGVGLISSTDFTLRFFLHY